MTTSVVGFFENQSQAKAVSEELVAQGIPLGSIEFLASDSAASAADAEDSESEKGFFARLGDMLGFTSDDENSASYREGVRRGGVLVVVKAADAQVDSVVTTLQRSGAVDISERAETWRKESATAGKTETTVTKAQSTAARTQAASEVALPVIEEELRVGKRVVQRGGVRIYTTVSERPVEENVRLHEEHVRVERHPVDRPITDADLKSFKQGTFEVTERAEELVVNKQARIVEEVVVSKQVAEHTEAVRDTLRRTDVEVEQLPVGVPSFESFSADFQRHWTSIFASGGGSFDQYLPAYRYGVSLAADKRYAGSEWITLEADARRSWEEQQPGTWDRFKSAIQYAWETVRSKVKSAIAS